MDPVKKAEMEVVEFEQKQVNWFERNATVIHYVCSGVILALIIYLVYRGR